MKYTEFENQFIETFERMHCIESCDDAFCQEFAEYDLQSILSRSFVDIFQLDREYYDGYVIERTKLIAMFEADEDNFLLEALTSFNECMDRYNVVRSYEYTLLHIK